MSHLNKVYIFVCSDGHSEIEWEYKEPYSNCPICCKSCHNMGKNTYKI